MLRGYRLLGAETIEELVAQIVRHTGTDGIACVVTGNLCGDSLYAALKAKGISCLEYPRLQDAHE